jgi:hypothetical protein
MKSSLKVEVCGWEGWKLVRRRWTAIGKSDVVSKEVASGASTLIVLQLNSHVSIKLIA